MSIEAHDRERRPLGAIGDPDPPRVIVRMLARDPFDKRPLAYLIETTDLAAAEELRNAIATACNEAAA